MPASESDSAIASISTSAPTAMLPTHDVSQYFAFPEGFVWGAATSSYQIEGAHDIDGRVPSIWDTFTRTPGKVKDASTGDLACDHYRRYVDDVQLMSDLHLAAYRFSISWPRIISDLSGTVNAAGLDFYDRLVDELLGKGIRPLPTLYHWDLPQYLDDDGGWLNRDTAERFAEYAGVVVDRLGDRIDMWTTLNEPYVSAHLGYVTGEHAPGRKSMQEGFAASHHLLLAHGLAAEQIRSKAPDASLAIVLNFTATEARTESDADRREAYHADQLRNHWYADPLSGYGYPLKTAKYYDWDQAEVQDGDLKKIAQPVDMLGINFYTRARVSAIEAEPAQDIWRNSMGWEIHPPSLGKILRWLDDRYNFPAMMITENGGPFLDDIRADGRIIDNERINYLSAHIAEVHQAIQDGVPVEGYLVWSLFDNFEWAWGYGPTFGIVEVDYATQQRRPKESALWLSEVIGANGFEAKMVDGTAFAADWRNSERL